MKKGLPQQSRNKAIWTALITLFLLAGAGVPAIAQTARPFSHLAGQWSGTGTIDLANGGREPLKCRAAYDVLERDRNVQMNIRCASESYNFDLRGSATEQGGVVSGNWSEETHNASGTLQGRADNNRVEVTARAASFAATLTLITRGDRQSVSIRTEDPQSSLKGASIQLRRS